MPVPGEEEALFLRKLKTFLEQRVVPGLREGKTVVIRIGGSEFDALSVGPRYVVNYADVGRGIGMHARRILLKEFGLHTYPTLDLDGNITFPPNDDGAPPIE